MNKIYKIDESKCKDDCENLGRYGLRIDLRKNDMLKIGDIVIPLQNVNVRIYPSVTLHPGERILIGEGNEKIYIEYPSNKKRLYIDVEKYQNVYHKLTETEEKELEVDGIKFRYEKYCFDFETKCYGEIFSEFDQEILSNTIILPAKSQVVFTTEGKITIEPKDVQVITFGECKEVEEDKVLCYGSISNIK